MIFQATDLILDKDTITYESYVFDKIKPAGEKAGITLDISGTNATTLFDGKVVDFTKAKTLVSRISLLKVTRLTMSNSTAIVS